MSGDDMPDLAPMPDGGDAKGLREWAENVQKQNAILREAGEAIKRDLTTLRKEQAFDTVGVPKDGWGKLLRETFNGEPSPDAVKAAMDAYGLAPQPAAPPSDPQPQAAPDPIRAELAELESNAQVRGQFSQPLVGANAVEQALLKAETREERIAIMREAGMLAEG